jgi:enamine deaminase RidA (YjgF/YER057c/UK114 family)
MNEGEVAAGLVQTPGYRYADRIAGRLHVAGQVPHDASGVMVGVGDVAAQCRQCLRNLLVLVEHHGFMRDDIHRLTIYVVGDRGALDRAWEVVVRDFDGGVPPATLLGVAVLGHEEQLVEIDAEVDREPRPLL